MPKVYFICADFICRLDIQGKITTELTSTPNAAPSADFDLLSPIFVDLLTMNFSYHNIWRMTKYEPTTHPFKEVNRPMAKFVAMLESNWIYCISRKVYIYR